jgi:hypothetical protein
LNAPPTARSSGSPSPAKARSIGVFGHSTPDTALALYRQHVSPTVRAEDLFTPNGRYIDRNRWNNGTTTGAMHLIQPNNTLLAEIELAAATVQRQRDGQLLTTEQELITCSLYGEPTRNSDPHIGGEVNALARAGADVTLHNPVGLYIDGLSTAGWNTPDDADPQDFWQITRGAPGFAVRAVYEVTGHDYLVGDITILARPIQFGGQIAEHITMRLTGTAHRFGQSTAQPRPCLASLDGAPGPLDATHSSPPPQPPTAKTVNCPGLWSLDPWKGCSHVSQKVSGAIHCCPSHRGAPEPSSPEIHEIPPRITPMGTCVSPQGFQVQ